MCLGALTSCGLPTFATPTPTLRGVRIVDGFFESTLTPDLAVEVGR
jgi:hypothetical protein